MDRVKLELNGAYKEAHNTDARYRIIYGGSGSGKSHFVGQETILNMLSNAEFQYMIVRKTGKSIRQSVFQLLITMISEYNLAKFFEINKTEMGIVCSNGSRLITSGLDDVEKLKSIVGINRIWVEEASEISEDDLSQLDLRMRGKNNLGYQMTLTFNPISELHWIKKKFFDVGVSDSFILKTTYKNNKHLDAQYIRRLEALINEDYQYYRIYALGEWGSLGNVIFTNWEKADLRQLIEVQDKTGTKQVPFCDTFDKFDNGVDFGFAEDPFAFIRSHYDKMNKTLYIVYEIYQRELHNDEAARILKPIVTNEAVICDSAEPKSISDLRRNDINAKGAKKGKDSILHGIKWLQGQKIVVDERCTNFIKELSGYKWREDKDGNVIPKPIDMNNHLIDALRYAMESTMLETNTQWGWK